MRIVFRVDSSDVIGTGHLMRCLTLADALRTVGADCSFIMRDHPGAQFDLVLQRGFECLVLPCPPQAESLAGDLAHSAWLGVAQEQDADEALDKMLGEFDWVVVDHYGIDHKWHSRVRAKANRVFVIDDLADRKLDCDVLLDQNLQVSANRYDLLTSASVTKLIGPRYALLREEFSRLRNEANNVSRNRLRRILVYFGGVDQAGGTILALRALELAELDTLQLDVVVGPRNPSRALVDQWCAPRPNTSFYDAGADMPQLMAQADLSIGAAGVTAWERCCLGLPSIILTIAENQQMGAEALAQSGGAFWLGNASTSEPAEMSGILKWLARQPAHLVAMSDAAAKAVDGRGLNRVVREFLVEPIAVRVVCDDDCLPIWEWRNDEGNRRYFNDPRPIAIEEHRRWFESVQGDRNRALLIGDDANGPVGVLRFDFDNDEAIMSIYLVPGRRGHGLGPKLIIAGLNWLADQPTPPSSVVAHVLSGNSASATAFERAGFTRASEAYKIELNLFHRRSAA